MPATAWVVFHNANSCEEGLVQLAALPRYQGEDFFSKAIQRAVASEPIEAARAFSAEAEAIAHETIAAERAAGNACGIIDCGEVATPSIDAGKHRFAYFGEDSLR